MELSKELDAEFIAKTAVYAGSDPSHADIVRMVHPKPNDPVREAFYGWLSPEQWIEKIEEVVT